ncbi:MAG TPA: serine/threonine protein kinase [Candidatus Blautia intestinavium]|nr:serine/threonine protein kinase [Candidatus Blautia intestinavium]
MILYLLSGIQESILGGDFISLTGIIIKGRYCIINQIGKGGEGALYLAKDLELGIYRAVKELPLTKKREAKLVRLLDHPFLPGMIDYAERGEYCYLVMEYIQGKSLGEYLKKGRQFTPEEILRIGNRVLQILIYLHARKLAVYYGDLKPDNLMMNEEGEVYLVDFGSAVLGYERQGFDCTGTIGYAAPEQYQGRVSSSSDIYALGKTLERLCGKKKIRYYILYPGLGLFIRKCCCGREDKRWRTAKEAEEAFAGIHPVSLKLKNVLIPTALILLTAIAAGRSQTEEKKLPPFDSALSGVTAWYYSMPYRSSGTGVSEEISFLIEEALQRLAKQYTDRKDQILLLLARNSELKGDEAKAEMYYRECKEEAEAFSAYGLFLIRQGRVEESRDIYEACLEENGEEVPEAYTMKMWREKLEIEEKKGNR